ncbi:MAG: DUF3320 domain-containing protein [Oscillospiraceae bacterium]|nr:DUF3320 domain-containing protein [Oscillospiraceae bacterium]
MGNIVSVGGHINASINFAMQQNYVPVIRFLTVNNESDQLLENVDLKISFEPEFAKEFRYHIDSIPAQGSVEISPVKINTNTDFLFSLTEKMVGNITVDVVQGEEELFTYRDSVELLAHDQWSGLTIMPEIIAAFVTPNHPSVSAIIHEASMFLKKWKGTPSFTGYQTNNPNNVKLQMAAIYAALAQQKIIYNNPPASYEIIGQRIRLPHIVLEQKMGTCLDLAVLYAACLEAVGLNPLLFFIKGHAFCGCWLENNTFADCCTDDVSAVEKRIAADAEEMLLVECTDFVDGTEPDFDRAAKHGKDHLINLFDFICVIDIQRSRGSGIRPMPQSPGASFSGIQLTEDGGKPKEAAAPSELNSSLLGRVAEGTDQPITKIRIWERKLLDFSLRNSLLNFRITKNTMQLMTADLGKLEDELADGTDFRIMEIPSEWTLSVRDAKIFAIENEKDLITSIAEAEFKSKRIRTFLSERDLDAALKNIYRSAKLSMEENGSNSLFLSLGLLRWFESDLSEKPRYAPIVLIPIDIVRNTRNKGYVIRSRQEDTQINVTLLEYLRQDHGINITGLDPLPLDEHGIDLPLVFNTIRQAVMGKKRWNIVEYAFIGLFSFSQFVMWNDLRNRSEELKQNKVVSSLIEGSLTYDPDDIEGTDSSPELDNMAVPMSADSSQLAAVAAAGRGQSFVLHGPPGTGKSQTITNMIANALYNGKTVLFVAEKMAALNVVQKRLENIGLDPFCLELHSNKTNKSSVLAELNKALEVGRIKSPEEYSSEAARLKEQKRKLNETVSALHEKRSCGITLYEAISAYERNSSEQGKISFSQELLESLTKEKLDLYSGLVHKYSVAIAETGSFAEYPLNDIGISSYSIEMRDKFRKAANELAENAAVSVLNARKLADIYGYSGTMDKTAAQMLTKIYEACRLDGELLPDLLSASHYDIVLQKIKDTLETGKEYCALCTEIFEKFEKSILDYPAAEAKMRRKQAEASWFLPKALGLGKLVKELKLHAKEPSSLKKTDLAEILDKLCIIGEKKDILRSVPSDITALLTGVYMNEQTDWDTLEKAVIKTDSVMTAIKLKSDAVPAEISKKLGTADCGSEGQALVSFFDKLDSFGKDFCTDMRSIEKEADWLTASSEKFRSYADNADKLRYAAEFNSADNELQANGLSCISESYRCGRINSDNIEAAFSCCLNYQLALMMIHSDSGLSGFSSNSCNDLIVQFKETIDKFSRLTMQELAARLSAKIPASGTASAATSEMGILKRAIKSNGRMMSLRSLFDKIPNLLRKLCPCMLMSPISVAQYIDPSFPKFDLVIFDEASQLPTAEAAGTIARGENVVIVGDPKQLPPTNFFSSNRIDEENSEKEDLESLLDDCLAISMPQRYLKWHYRSRHESLITYSNMKYYDNKLLTFPSHNDLVSEVSVVHPEGFYDKGRTKQNKAEAKAVVAEIIRRLSDEKLRNDSIGVVTFSSVQQNLIDDMLCEEWAKHPELEDFDRKSAEPIFIKNLENVQGDERDVILFSVGYGPDENGNVSMNFGPLNRDGGWRRLNVAISRARKSMIVYSVLRPEQIDLSRTRSEGVAGLKGFLEFAEKGKLAVVQRPSTDSAADNTIAECIAEEIRHMGYTVKCGIGCSEFKVDIGIIDPDNENEYLLGILLDGQNSINGLTAQDRFVLQPGVLKGLGWNIIRIWTLDWLDDKERVLRNIKAAVDNAPKQENMVTEAVRPAVFAAADFEKEDASQLISAACKPYVSAAVDAMGTSDEYYLPQNKRKIKQLAEKIIAEEAPISRKLLMKKVLNAWSITRGGSKVEGIFLDAISTISTSITTDENRTFIWKKDQAPEQYAFYRVDRAETNKRSIDDISSYEILNAVNEVLCEQISLSETDLIKETAKKFGYSRTGGVIESTVRYAIQKGVSSGKLVISDKTGISLSE